MDSWLGRPEFLAAVVVAAVLQLALLAVALVKLVRTPAGRLTLPLPIWVLVILGLSWIGPVLFLVAGTRPASIDHAPSASDGDADSVEAKIRRLYS